MLTNFFMAFLFITAYFGLYCLIELLDDKFNKSTEINNNNLRIVLFVKNMEDNIEYTIRRLSQSKFEGFTNQEKIVIIDMESTDRTLDILNKIAYQDEGIIVLKFDEKDKVFQEYRNYSGR